MPLRKFIFEVCRVSSPTLLKLQGSNVRMCTQSSQLGKKLLDHFEVALLVYDFCLLCAQFPAFDIEVREKEAQVE